MKIQIKRALVKAPLYAVIIFSALWAVNCSQGDTTVIQVSSEAGGKVSLASNAHQATLSVPAGALSENTAINVNQIDGPDAQGDIVPLNVAYEFGPNELQFLKPANLDICYDVQELIDAGLSESTVSIYYLDPDTGDLASIGGTVNTATHCVSAEVDHFSTYIPAASALAAINNAPVVGTPTFLPSRAIAGIPLTFRSIVTSHQTANLLGSIASVSLSYRIAGSGAAFTTISMQPDYTDASGQRYTAKIPDTEVTLAGLEYYIEATDNLNRVKSNPNNAPAGFRTRTITRTLDPLTPLRINPANVSLSVSAGYSRDLTLQVQDNAAKWRNIVPDAVTLTGTPANIGTTTTTSPSVTRFKASKVGNGSIDFTAGAYNIAQAIEVHPGSVDHMAFFDDFGVQIIGPIDVSAAWSYQFDILGYDAFGNTIPVLPNFTTTNGIGTVDAAGLFTAGMTYPSSGTLDATLGALNASITINIITPPTV